MPFDPTQLAAAATEVAPAGGAELRDVIIASALVGAILALLVALTVGHRSGRMTLLKDLGGLGEWITGLPGWVVIPVVVWAIGGATALFGLHWDEASHIDNGRDPGPLANPSHYLLIGGIMGILASGWLAIVLPGRGEPTGPASIRLTEGWRAPLGGIVIVVAAAFGALGFPLDDVSHRIFGQDVTLWGTTHVWMIAGMVLTLWGLLILVVEGQLAKRSKGPDAERERPPFMQRYIYAALGGAVLFALSAFQGEFDYGVPQFRLLFHPVLIAFTAGLSLTFIRIAAGRGAALTTVLAFIALRSVFALAVGPTGFGQTLGMFPLYLAEGVLVELVARGISPSRNPYRFAAISAALIGTLGVLAEYAWTNAAMPIGWPAHMLPEAMALATIAALAGAAIGVFMALALELRGPLVAQRRVWGGALAGIVVFGAVFAYLLPTTEPDVRASVTLDETVAGAEREVAATIRFEPAGAVADADWLRLIAYQGGERQIGSELDEIAPDVYRTEPFPVHGTWKSAIRFHRGSEMASVPVFLPEDPEIPAAEVPALNRFERPLIEDKTLLQRELSTDVPAWATPAAWAFVGSALFALIFGIGWAFYRLATVTSVDDRTPGGSRSIIRSGPDEGRSLDESRSKSSPSAADYRSEPAEGPATTGVGA